RGSANAPGPTGPNPRPAPLGAPPKSSSSAGSPSGGEPSVGQQPSQSGQADQASQGETVGGFDPVTGLVLGPDGVPLLFGGTGGQYQLAGEQSWKQLLLAGLQS